FPQGLADPMESDTLAHNAKAGFRLQQLYASISPNAEPDQLISGPVWQSLIGQIPKVVPGAPSGYNDYRWDYSIVLNADTVDEIGINPYDAFIGTTPSGNSYWTGGSLGIIEFIGRYENSADNEVVVPFRQDVELFVPPIPVIEIKGQSDAEGETLIFCESQAQIDITAFPS